MKNLLTLLLILFGSLADAQEVSLPDSLEFHMTDGSEVPFDAQLATKMRWAYFESKPSLAVLVSEVDTCCFYGKLHAQFSQWSETGGFALRISYKLIEDNDCIDCLEENGIFYIWKSIEVPYDEFKHQLMLSEYEVIVD